MIRPLEWTERTQQAAGITDLFLRAYLPTGACVFNRKAYEEGVGTYAAKVLFGETLFVDLDIGPIDDPVDVDNKELHLFIDDRLRILAFGHEDGELPLSSTEKQGGLVQQIQANSPIRAAVQPTGDGTYYVRLSSPYRITVLSGDAVATLKLVKGEKNFVTMIGQRLILRWYSTAAGIDEKIGVMLTGDTVSDEVITAVG